MLTAKGQPYELVDLEEGKRGFLHGPRTLRELFSSTNCAAPFLVFNDETLTFCEAWRRACRIGRQLIEQFGVSKGDRVAVSMRNYPEWIIAMMASTSIGAIFCGLNSLWSAVELEHSLNNISAKVLFADEERLRTIEQMPSLQAPLTVVAVRASQLGRSSDDGHLRFINYTDLLGDPRAQRHKEEDEAIVVRTSAIAADDDALMLFTSGSTGFPKGVLSSHRSVLSALLTWELESQVYVLEHAWAPPLGLPPAALLGVPLFHVTGLHACLLQCYRSVRKLVLMHKWHPATALQLIEAHNVTLFTAPPAMTGDLLRLLAPGRAPSLRVVGGGGAHRAPEQVKAIGARQLVPSTGWGMTETNALGLGISFIDYLQHPASSGRVSAVLDARIVDIDTGAVVACPRQRGELQVRGVSVMRGYWRRAEATQAAFTSDGWLRTGDVAYFDEDHFFYLVDRIKDLVIRGGENIGVGHIEHALLEHPDVVECSVYSVPDDRLGEEVAATIYSVDARLNEAHLLEFLQPRLGRFELPRYFRFVNSPLQRIATGKIDKRRIREEHLTLLSKEHHRSRL